MRKSIMLAGTGELSRRAKWQEFDTLDLPESPTPYRATMEILEAASYGVAPLDPGAGYRGSGRSGTATGVERVTKVFVSKWELLR